MLQIQSGDRHTTISFPPKSTVEILRADGLPEPSNPVTEIEQTITDQAGAAIPPISFLSEAVQGRVAIAVTDAVIHENLVIALPSLLAYLYQKNATLKPASVTIVVAEGIKRSPQSDRFKKLFQKLNASGCRVIVHDPILQTMAHLGTTRRGTPVRVNSELANADLKIVIDQIKPNPLFGFVESPLRLARCCMAIDSIEELERMVLSSSGKDCRLDSHPVFDEMGEIIRRVGIDGSIAGISNPTGKTIKIMAGEPATIFRQVAAMYRRHYSIPISEPFDIAVISFGPGCPKQFLDAARDGLLVAAHLLKEGGKVLIIGNNTQGVGLDIFFDYACHCLSPSAVISGFIASGNRPGTGEPGPLYGQSLPSPANLEKVFGREVIRHCQLRAADPSTVLAEWADEYKDPPRIAVIPEGYGIFCYPD